MLSNARCSRSRSGRCNRIIGFRGKFQLLRLFRGLGVYGTLGSWAAPLRALLCGDYTYQVYRQLDNLTGTFSRKREKRMSRARARAKAKVKAKAKAKAKAMAKAKAKAKARAEPGAGATATTTTTAADLRHLQPQQPSSSSLRS